MEWLLDALSSLFDTSDFPARWTCGRWTALHGWTHIVADLLVFAAYFAIPLVIVIYQRKRRDTEFSAVFALFAVFILSCGTVHFAEAVIFWHPWYRVSALLKVVTAVASWATVFALIRVFPRAMRLPRLAALSESLAEENKRRERVEHELRRKNEDLNDFAHIASHDLRAPLRAIDLLAGWIDDDAGEHLPDKSRQHLDTLRSRVNRMDSLLGGLLIYARAGRDEAEIEHVETTQLVKEVADLLVPPGGARIEVGELPDVHAPRTALELVFRNVLSNALKHHDRDDPKIEVRGRIEGDSAVFEIEDDGPGVPEEARERVFALFATLKPRDEVEGSGMGLSIVRKVAESLGGTAAITDARGRGALVTIRIERDARSEAARRSRDEAEGP